jgi:hypothetical protein
MRRNWRLLTFIRQIKWYIVEKSIRSKPPFSKENFLYANLRYVSRSRQYSKEKCQVVNIVSTRSVRLVGRLSVCQPIGRWSGDAIELTLRRDCKSYIVPYEYIAFAAGLTSD